MRETIREKTYEKMYFKIMAANCNAIKLIERKQYQEAYRLLERAGQETEELYMSMPDDEEEEKRKKRFLYPWDIEYREE